MDLFTHQFSIDLPTQMPRYYIHETIRLFLVLVVFYQVWFQFWYAIGLVLVLGYGYKEHRVKRNVSQHGWKRERAIAR